MAKEQGQASAQENTTGVQAHTCKCENHRDKPRNLALRPDLAGDKDGHSVLALCIFNKPPIVHEWNGDGYVVKEDLELKNNQVVRKTDGTFYASATTPSLSDLDTDDEVEEVDDFGSDDSSQGGSQPTTGSHVDLDDDEFY